MNLEFNLKTIHDNLAKVANHAKKNDFNEASAEKCIGAILGSFKNLKQAVAQKADKKTLDDIQVSIQTIEKSAKNQELKTKLSDLSSRIDHIGKYGIIKQKFKAESTASSLEILQSSVKSLFRFLSKNITNEIHKMIYMGWSEKVKNENLKEAIRNQLETKYNEWYERKLAKAKNETEVNLLDQRFADEMREVDTQLAKDKKLQEIEKIQEKGKATRAQMVEIGGKRIELETADGVKLDATYLSAEKFLAKFHENDGKSVTLNLNNDKKIKGISFLAESASLDKLDDLSKLLQDLNLVSTEDKLGSGYCLVEDPKDKSRVFLIEQQQLDLNRASFRNKDGEPLIDRDGRYNFDTPIKIEDEKLPMTLSNQNGAAILTSGNMGVYEMHKGEAMALLMQGVDVMLFNLRGYGESEGEPTGDGSYLDIEAAYQYVKKEREGLADSKITAWSMCLSGGIGAYLVEKHPEMNLFLNQTYANMASIIKKPILNKIKEKLGSNSLIQDYLNFCLTEIVYFAFSMIAPDYKVANRLRNIKGRVCTIQALSDSLMGQEETKEMTSVLKNHSVKHTPVEIPGKHCSNWTQASVPEITIKKKNETIKRGIQDYLKVTVDGTVYYPSKELLNSKNGVTINEINFKRASKENYYEILVTKNNNKTETKKAKELETEDGKDFINKMKKSKSVDASFEYNWLGHTKINQFLESADLSRPLI